MSEGAGERSLSHGREPRPQRPQLFAEHSPASSTTPGGERSCSDPVVARGGDVAIVVNAEPVADHPELKRVKDVSPFENGRWCAAGSRQTLFPYSLLPLNSGSAFSQSAVGSGAPALLLSARGSGIQHYVRKRAADADKAPALLQIFVVQCKSEVLVHLTFEALYDTGRAGTAAAVVGVPEPGVFDLFEDVLVLGALYGYAPAPKGHLVGLRHVSPIGSYVFFWIVLA